MTDAVRRFLAEVNPDAVIFDGLEDALIGVACQFTHEPLAVYNRAAIVALLVGQGMTEDDAEEYLQFNIEGLWAGVGTPLILRLAADL